MQKVFRAVILTFVAAFILSQNVSVFGQDPVKVRELYKRMSENQRTLKSLKARLRMESYNSQIGDSDEKDGEIRYISTGAKKADLRIDWQAPQQETLSVVGGEYKLYRPRLNQVYVGKTAQQQKVGSGLSFINMSGAELKQNFDAQWLSDGELIANNSISAYKMKLTPKTPQKYDYAEIWVTENGMPAQIKIYEKNKDTTTVLIYEPQKNAKISKDELKLKFPKGTTVTQG